MSRARAITSEVPMVSKVVLRDADGGSGGVVLVVLVLVEVV